MTELDDEAAAIERALRAALHRLAPLGGEHRLHVNAAAAALVAVLAALLAATPDAAGEAERMVELFRQKLVGALAERSAGNERRH
jgi:hypothetical protein